MAQAVSTEVVATRRRDRLVQQLCARAGPQRVRPTPEPGEGEGSECPAPVQRLLSGGRCGQMACRQRIPRQIPHLKPRLCSVLRTHELRWAYFFAYASVGSTWTSGSTWTIATNRRRTWTTDPCAPNDDFKRSLGSRVGGARSKRSTCHLPSRPPAVRIGNFSVCPAAARADTGARADDGICDGDDLRRRALCAVLGRDAHHQQARRVPHRRALVCHALPVCGDGRDGPGGQAARPAGDRPARLEQDQAFRRVRPRLLHGHLEQHEGAHGRQRRDHHRLPRVLSDRRLLLRLLVLRAGLPVAALARRDADHPGGRAELRPQRSGVPGAGRRCVHLGRGLVRAAGVPAVLRQAPGDGPRSDEHVVLRPLHQRPLVHAHERHRLHQRRVRPARRGGLDDARRLLAGRLLRRGHGHQLGGLQVPEHHHRRRLHCGRRGAHRARCASYTYSLTMLTILATLDVLTPLATPSAHR
eukprot:scaffold24579_cov60-Phaeocystis_antarctica.AAC.3